MIIEQACHLYYELMKTSGIAKTPKKRGVVCIPAEHPQNRSKIDRFVINKLSEAKKAVQRIMEMTKPPKWWDGSVDEIKSIIMEQIKKTYSVQTKDGQIVVSKKS